MATNFGLESAGLESAAQTPRSVTDAVLGLLLLELVLMHQTSAPWPTASSVVQSRFFGQGALTVLSDLDQLYFC
jgi:hypothetical protein